MRKSGTLSKIAYWIIGLSLIFAAVGFEDAMVSFHKPVDIYDEDFEGLKRYMAVESDLDIIISSFLQETVTHTKNGSTTSVDKYNYYSVPVFVGDECYYVALKVSNNTANDNQIKKVVKETMAYLTYKQDTYGDEKMEFSGGVYKTKKDIYSEMKSWFKEAGFFENDSDVEKYVLPYQLEPIVSFERVRTIFIACVAIILVGILLIVIDRKVISARA
ncbi:MAG: hypothetical protein K2G55_14490 [Lachnospiraceae bacterium]|nr:hypothetical protein [Lachnospiraceae bacterium]MDE7204759.1 hypothetical protein [Lachnospiraceae bacterium]